MVVQDTGKSVYEFHDDDDDESMYDGSLERDTHVPKQLVPTCKVIMTKTKKRESLVKAATTLTTIRFDMEVPLYHTFL